MNRKICIIDDKPETIIPFLQSLLYIYYDNEWPVDFLLIDIHAKDSKTERRFIEEKLTEILQSTKDPEGSYNAEYTMIEIEENPYNNIDEYIDQIMTIIPPNASVLLDLMLIENDTDRVANDPVLSMILFEKLKNRCIPYTNYISSYQKIWEVKIKNLYNNIVVPPMLERCKIDAEATVNEKTAKALYDLSIPA